MVTIYSFRTKYGSCDSHIVVWDLNRCDLKVAPKVLDCNKADILTKCLDNTEFERQVGNIQLQKIKKKEGGQHRQ